VRWSIPQRDVQVAGRRARAADEGEAVRRPEQRREPAAQVGRQADQLSLGQHRVKRELQVRAVRLPEGRGRDGKLGRFGAEVLA